MHKGKKLDRKIQRETVKVAGKIKNNDCNPDNHDDVLGCAGLAVQPPWAVRAGPRLLRVLLSQAVDRGKMPGEVMIIMVTSMKSSDHTRNMYFL